MSSSTKVRELFIDLFVRFHSIDWRKFVTLYKHNYLEVKLDEFRNSIFRFNRKDKQ